MTPARCMPPNGFIGARAVGAEPLLVQLAGGAPGGVERRLDARDDAEVGEAS